MYDLRQDVGEDHDLAAEEPDLAESLRAELDDWLQQVDAKIPQPNPDWVPPKAT